MRYAKIIAQPVPQTEPLNQRQVPNNAGGFVFQLDNWKRLDRFLVLGSDAATYYQSAPKLTRENAACVVRCYDADATRTVARIVEISHEGRAPKNDAAIFALALGAAHADVKVRHKALSALPLVCRTSTHLFQFVGNCRALGKGWGRALKRVVAEWYDKKSVESVAFQAIKYRAREGFTHKRLLDMARPHNKDSATRVALYRWMKGKLKDEERVNLPAIIAAHEQAMVLAEAKPIARLVKEHRLPWEAIPTSVTKDPDVWRAMLPEMGLTALIRNLGALTSYGVLKPLAKEVGAVVARLENEEELRKARIHPFNVLLALAAYRGGASISARQYGKAGLSWEPVAQVQDALEAAFYASFKSIVPTGKRILIGLDVSGSMSSPLMGSALSVCEGAAAMAMTIMRSEKNWHVHAFADRFRKLPLTAKMSLPQVLEHTSNVNFGGTDCSLPMTYAQEEGLDVDVFMVFTDNETWAGRVHPVQALKQYRQKSGLASKLIVVGMTSTGFTIADPQDGGMLDVVGFDSAAPVVMADFMRG